MRSQDVNPAAQQDKKADVLDDKQRACNLLNEAIRKMRNDYQRYPEWKVTPEGLECEREYKYQESAEAKLPPWTSKRTISEAFKHVNGFLTQAKFDADEIRSFWAEFKKSIHEQRVSGEEVEGQTIREKFTITDNNMLQFLSMLSDPSQAPLLKTEKEGRINEIAKVIQCAPLARIVEGYTTPTSTTPTVENDNPPKAKL